jgi:uncharacterized protein (DUF2062 family)
MKEGTDKTVRFADKIKTILSVGDPPHLIASSFAIGLFFGISPLIGLHTVLGLAVAWLFRLNKFVVLTGVYVTNPWSIIPIYTFCTWAGAVILRRDSVVPDVNWHSMTLGGIFGEFSHILLPFVVGTTVVALASSILSYFIIRHTVEKVRNRQPAKESL